MFIKEFRKHREAKTETREKIVARKVCKGSSESKCTGLIRAVGYVA